MILNTEESTFQIYEGYGWKNDLIKVGATTCYRSEDKTKKTGDEFVDFLLEKTHFSTLEFAWFPFMIRPLGPRNKDLEIELLAWFNQQKYLEASLNEKGIIVSGNGRAWRDYFSKNYDFPYSKPILTRLKMIANNLFSDIGEGGPHPEIQAVELKAASIRSLSKEHRECK